MLARPSTRPHAQSDQTASSVKQSASSPQSPLLAFDAGADLDVALERGEDAVVGRFDVVVHWSLRTNRPSAVSQSHRYIAWSPSRAGYGP